jgi:hypothetical protein
MVCMLPRLMSSHGAKSDSAGTKPLQGPEARFRRAQSAACSDENEEELAKVPALAASPSAPGEAQVAAADEQNRDDENAREFVQLREHVQTHKSETTSPAQQA